MTSTPHILDASAFVVKDCVSRSVHGDEVMKNTVCEISIRVDSCDELSWYSELRYKDLEMSSELFSSLYKDNVTWIYSP